MGTCEYNAGGNSTMDKCPFQGGVEILLVTSCYSYKNRDKLLPDGPLGSLHADLSFALQTFRLITILLWDPAFHCRKWTHHQIHSL